MKIIFFVSDFRQSTVAKITMRKGTISINQKAQELIGECQTIGFGQDEDSGDFYLTIDPPARYGKVIQKKENGELLMSCLPLIQFLKNKLSSTKLKIEAEDTISLQIGVESILYETGQVPVKIFPLIISSLVIVRRGKS